MINAIVVSNHLYPIGRRKDWRNECPVSYNYVKDINLEYKNTGDIGIWRIKKLKNENTNK